MIVTITHLSESGVSFGNNIVTHTKIDIDQTFRNLCCALTTDGFLIDENTFIPPASIVRITRK